MIQNDSLSAFDKNSLGKYACGAGSLVWGLCARSYHKLYGMALEVLYHMCSVWIKLRVSNPMCKLFLENLHRGEEKVYKKFLVCSGSVEQFSGLSFLSNVHGRVAHLSSGHDRARTDMVRGLPIPAMDSSLAFSWKLGLLQRLERWGQLLAHAQYCVSVSAWYGLATV